MDHDSHLKIRQIRTTAMWRLLPLIWPKAKAQHKTQAELAAVWAEIQRGLTREQDEEQAKLLGQLAQADSAALQAALKDKNPLVQFTAIQTIHRRRLHLETELIECLTHPQP